ncbi:WxPxxD family membrane protein [Bacillus paralicheniformis]|uniref:WxPxxD family membrane protein n=1 Tax=Bacillus paralicheniformis TaxID=1648923 RepID=UPI003627C6A6
MKTKRIFLIIGLIIFFSIVWIGQNSAYFENKTYETLLYINNGTFGYNSIMAYSLLFPVPYLIFLINFFHSDTSYRVVRFTKRQSFYKSIVVEVLISSLIFSAIHTLINFVYTCFFINSTILEDVNFWLACLLNMMSVMFFYTVIGILFRMIYDRCNLISVSIFITYLLIGSLYSFVKLFLFDGMWTPLKDFTVFADILKKQSSFFYLFNVFVRQIFLVFIFYIVGSSTFLKKDYIK